MNTTETESKDIQTSEQLAQAETPLESLASICTVIVIFLFISTCIFQNFEIPSGSMEKTLLIGDHVLVDRMALAPPTSWAPFVYYRNVRRGDIIVFYKP
ncbi:MAG: signal peptidase I, partial [Edaphobacter sp.]